MSRSGTTVSTRPTVPVTCFSQYVIGVADQLGHAEGQHREIGAAQVQHRRAHHHRHRAREPRAERDRRRPVEAARAPARWCRRRCRRRPRWPATGSACCRRTAPSSTTAPRTSGRSAPSTRRTRCRSAAAPAPSRRGRTAPAGRGSASWRLVISREQARSAASSSTRDEHRVRQQRLQRRAGEVHARAPRSRPAPARRRARRAMLPKPPSVMTISAVTV